MPSIAQQDYLRPSGKATNDCHLLAALAHNIEQGTIFDTIFGANEPDSDIIDYSKVVGLRKTDRGYDLSVVEVASPKIFNLLMQYTQTQYEGLAAIQDAGEEWSDIPRLSVQDNGGVIETAIGIGVVGANGHDLRVTVADGKIASVAMAETDSYDISISWEDAQKLIGLPVS